MIEVLPSNAVKDVPRERSAQLRSVNSIQFSYVVQLCHFYPDFCIRNSLGVVAWRDNNNGMTGYREKSFY